MRWDVCKDNLEAFDGETVSGLEFQSWRRVHRKGSDRWQDDWLESLRGEVRHIGSDGPDLSGYWFVATGGAGGELITRSREGAVYLGHVQRI